MPSNPDLTFFCELEAESLQQLFQNRFVVDDLKALNAGVSLGIMDLSDERAEVVRLLNRMRVPVTAWLLLPKDQGYWFNLSNFPYAIARYEAFKQWTKDHDLVWAGIGLDIEPDYHEMEALSEKNYRVLGKMMRRLKDKTAYQEAELAYIGLSDQIRRDGWPVEAYHAPLIIDDRQARSSTIQRGLGLIDVQADRVVLMLYSSFLRPHGHQVLKSYLRDTDSVGIGSTGGGVQMAGEPDALNWEEFSYDLRLAWREGKPIHIFSLEGCVEQGFLEKLITFNWNVPVEPPKTGLLDAGRKGLQGVIWLVERPLVIAGAIGSGILALLVSKHYRKR